jgi:hypothetical protein
LWIIKIGLKIDWCKVFNMGYSNIVKAVCQFLNCDSVLNNKLHECEAGSEDAVNKLKSALGGKLLAEQSLSESNIALSQCCVERDELKGHVSELKAQLENIVIPKEDPMETYWNSKYPKKDIRYVRTEHDRDYEIDVRTYFQPYDNLTEGIVIANKLNEGSFDERALKCLKWVRAKIVYTPDKTEFGIDEFWSYHYQTIDHGKGDCECGAIVLANLMLVAGIPYWKIRLTAGNTPYGGHAYIVYLLDDNSKWVCLDWCFFYNDSPVKARPDYKDDKLYGDIWFSVNQKYSFGEVARTISVKDNDFLKKIIIK